MDGTQGAGSAGDPPAPDHGRGWYSRGYLPHFDRPGILQMVTFRLADSLPKGLFTPALAIGYATQQRRNLEEILDHGYGEC